MNDIGTFPKRLPTRSCYPKLTENTSVMKYSDIYKKLLSTTMSVYSPLAMLFPSRRDEYEAKYEIDLQKEDKNANALGQGLTRQINRESGIKKLMTINLLKRLESSVQAFRITLKSLIKTNQEMIDLINRFENGERSLSIAREVASFVIEDEDEDEMYSFSKENTGKIIDIRLSDIDVYTWRRDIQNDIAILTEIYADMQKVTPDQDENCLSSKQSLTKR